jgi:hypothetical protein
MKRQFGITTEALLEHPQVRRFNHNGRLCFAAVDVVAALTEQLDPREAWNALKQREPRLARWVETIEDGIDILDLDGLLRLVQAIDSPVAERIKWWIAEAGRQRIEESEHPELAVLRTRRLYEDRGYPRRWVEKRVRGVSSRHELTGEWYKRGARESDDFRGLTNLLMRSAFGMDVQHYREFKGLARPGPALRDSMTDMELTLTSLAETTAAALSRARNSQGLEQLAQDARDAGEIAAATLSEIERRTGATVKSGTARPAAPAPETIRAA